MEAAMTTGRRRRGAETSARRLRGWVLFVAALAARCLLVGLLHGVEVSAPTTYEHGEIARNLLSGQGFRVRFLGSEGLTSQQAPFYPYLLAAFFWAAGGETPAALAGVLLLQCLAGACVAPLVATVAERSFRDPPAGLGWWAGLAAAFFPTHVYAATHFQVVVWNLLGLALFLRCLVMPPTRPLLRAAGCGLTGGLLCLIDPILALPVGMGLAYLACRAAFDHGLPAACRVAGTAGLLLAAVTAPWTIRNAYVHHEFVFVKSTFGYAFWQANNPSSHGTDKIPTASAREWVDHLPRGLRAQHQALWEARHETIYIDDLLLGPTNYAEFRGLTEPARSRLLFARAADFIRAEPARYAGLCLSRARYLLWLDETNPKARHPLYRLTTVVWLVAFVGGLLLLRGRAEPTETVPTGTEPAGTVLLAMVAALVLFHILTITAVRFRLPIELITFPWCAALPAWCVAHLPRLRPAGITAIERAAPAG